MTLCIITGSVELYDPKGFDIPQARYHDGLEDPYMIDIGEGLNDKDFEIEPPVMSIGVIQDGEFVPTTDDIPPIARAPEDPELLEAVKKILECQRGIGGWGAIQEQTVFETTSELPIFKDGLDRNAKLAKLAKAYEECRGIKAYPLATSPEYLNKHVADLLGVDYLGREPTRQGLDMSDSPLTDPVSDQELLDDAAFWLEWVCSPEREQWVYCPIQEVDFDRSEQYSTDRAPAYQEWLNEEKDRIIQNPRVIACQQYYPVEAHKAFENMSDFIQGCVTDKIVGEVEE